MLEKAREAIKYLVADGRYDFIETGSLISIKENVKDIVIPSEERHIKMYPMDFEEFCWALGEKPLIPYIRSCFEKRQPLEQGIHNKAMLLFKQYLLVGGMPKAVAEFVEGQKSFGAADIEKRVVFNRIVKGSSAEQYEETFFWLSDSMVCNECRRTNDPNVGLSLNESDTYIKCYLGDTGLLVSHAFDENELHPL